MSEYIIYDRNNHTGTIDGNTSATFRESVKKLIKSRDNTSGDITIEKIGISEIINGEIKLNVKFDSNVKLMNIDLPFENSKDLSACKNAKKALGKINGLDIKNMDFGNLITFFMCMVCKSEEERAKTLQKVSNQMGIANMNFSLGKREIDRYAAEMQESSSKTEAWGTIVKSCGQFAISCAALKHVNNMSNKNQELSSCKEAKASADLQKKLNENNKSLGSLDKQKLSSFDAGNKEIRQEEINKCNDNDTKKALESRKQILEDAESRGFELRSGTEDGKIDGENFCKKFEVTVKNNDFTLDDGNGNKLITEGNRSYTSDKFYEENGENSDYLKTLDSRIGTLTAEINIAESKMNSCKGLVEAAGGIVEGGYKLMAAGGKYSADIAKADKEYIDATMNLVNNLWSNFRQDFSAALNRVDKTASILKEAIDSLLQTNMQISRNI